MPDNFWKQLVRVESGNLLLGAILIVLVVNRSSDLWIGGVLGALLRGIESRRYPSFPAPPPAVKP